MCIGKPNHGLKGSGTFFGMAPHSAATHDWPKNESDPDP